MNEQDRVREKMVEYLGNSYVEDKLSQETFVDWVLRLPELAVLADDQELPFKMPSRLRYPISCDLVNQMLKAGFRRVL